MRFLWSLGLGNPKITILGHFLSFIGHLHSLTFGRFSVIFWSCFGYLSSQIHLFLSYLLPQCVPIVPFCLLKSIVSGLLKSFHPVLYLFNYVLWHVQHVLMAVVRALEIAPMLWLLSCWWLVYPAKNTHQWETLHRHYKISQQPKKETEHDKHPKQHKQQKGLHNVTMTKKQPKMRNTNNIK